MTSIETTTLADDVDGLQQHLIFFVTCTSLLMLQGVFGQPNRRGRKVAQDDAMERTYDLLWHDLIQHREGKGK